MAKKQMSREGYEKLEKELAYLVTEKRAEVAQKLKEARSFGDLSENAEVVDDDKISVDEIGMSSVITIRKVGSDKIEKFTIVGTNHADIKAGKLSDESPIGKAALKKKVGDIFTVEAPAGELKFEVLEISK